jgi:propionyl-CoA carboxylase alpha chain
MEYTPGDRLVEAESGTSFLGVKLSPTRTGLKMTTRGADP